MEQSKEEIVTYVFGPGSNATNLKLMFDKLEYVKDGFKDCGTQSLELLTGLAQNNPNLLGELLGQIPEIKELFYKQSNYTCSITLSAEQMATLLATHLPEQTWVHLAGAYGVSSILTSFKNNYPGYFISQAVMYNKTILATTQQSQNLYGGNYGGIENYFAYIRNYFGQSIYDQVTAGFMQQSSVYTDSLRLEEWHMYVSPR
ncbi:MAG: hypothetical protein LCH37_12670 [Bacteroidetes bacterium]|nr:hypothetical protein [Bacteroidota bacterium]